MREVFRHVGKKQYLQVPQPHQMMEEKDHDQTQMPWYGLWVISYAWNRNHKHKANACHSSFHGFSSHLSPPRTSHTCGTWRVSAHVSSYNVFAMFWNLLMALPLGVLCCSCTLQHSSSMECLTWLEVEFLWVTLVLYDIENHVPTCASTIEIIEYNISQTHTQTYIHTYIK